MSYQLPPFGPNHPSFFFFFPGRNWQPQLLLRGGRRYGSSRFSSTVEEVGYTSFPTVPAYTHTHTTVSNSYPYDFPESFLLLPPKRVQLTNLYKKIYCFPQPPKYFKINITVYRKLIHLYRLEHRHSIGSDV